MLTQFTASSAKTGHDASARKSKPAQLLGSSVLSSLLSSFVGGAGAGGAGLKKRDRDSIPVPVVLLSLRLFGVGASERCALCLQCPPQHLQRRSLGCVDTSIRSADQFADGIAAQTWLTIQTEAQRDHLALA